MWQSTASYHKQECRFAVHMARECRLSPYTLDASTFHWLALAATHRSMAVHAIQMGHY